VREVAPDTLIVTDGFSCRSQIEQSTERRALHVAQVIQLARDHGASGPPGSYPERAATPPPQPTGARRAARTAALAGALAVGGAGLALLARR
jgi:hypothetical protein